ncbi:VG15 protein [Mangrovihabitans endophyticus]|uniref:MuF-like minor capsid protein n=1 Tax=Mangrovihabitans endophyticus TaxID=1751298 RepID=A0A8J3BZM6_9ACTN|nr:hypothetical protein [Mangrovihabitans endophyticus]GGK89269.1 hypothetical protein GCM10012284_24070 [Mangrovihabitans endophyticus]
MARTGQGAALTAAHRAQQLAVRAGSLRELFTLWKMVDPTDLSGTIDVFVRAALILVDQGYDESGAAASAYFGLFRQAERVAGAAPAVRAAPRLERAYVAGQVRGAALKGIITARRAGVSVAVAHDRGLVRVAGAVSKLVLAGGRQTLISAVDEDPRALGWSRVTSGDPCAFCRMLASRGPVYASRKLADFETHDSCACTPEPGYARGLTQQAQQWRREYDTAQQVARASGAGSSGTDNDALNNYRRYLSGASTTAPEGAG